MKGSYPVDAEESVDYYKNKSHKRRQFAWDLFNSLNIIALIVIVIVDLSTSQSLTWSRYPIAALGLVWLLVASFVIFKNFKHKAIPISIVYVVSTTVFLALLDWFDKEVSWFLDLALPILGVLTGVIVITVLILLKMKLKGWSVPGVILIGISVICFGMDILISIYAQNENIFSWSLIVLLATLPLGILSLVLQHRLGRPIDLNKIFHI